MWRAAAFMLAVGGAFYAGQQWPAQRTGPVTPLIPPRTMPAAHEQSCADECEQHAIVSHGSDDATRQCRARCGELDPPQRPRETPRSVTVAPADHHRTN